MQIFDPPPRHRLRLPRPSVPRVVRRPLAWLVAAEVAVCLALVGTAWHLVATTAAAAAPSLAAAGIGAAPAPSDSPLPSFAGPGGTAVPAHPAARPSLGTGAPFLGGLLNGLNHDQAAFENAEWSGLQALTGAIRLYIERVMVPAVERAEKSGAR